MNPHEVIDMIDEYTDGPHNCECYLLEDEKIKKLIQRSIVMLNQHIHPLIQGIGAITEQRLWDSGIRDWDSIDGNIPIPVSPRR